MFTVPRVALAAASLLAGALGGPAMPVRLQELIPALQIATGRKSRGKGRGAPARRFGNAPGCYRPHQGRQERMRRLVGGFYGVRKADAVAGLRPVHRRAA